MKRGNSYASLAEPIKKDGSCRRRYNTWSPISNFDWSTWSSVSLHTAQLWWEVTLMSKHLFLNITANIATLFPSSLDHSLSLWEVNVGDWKQEAEATVWLKHSAGIFSAGHSNPLALASFRPAGGHHYPLLNAALLEKQVRLRGAPITRRFISGLSVNSRLSVLRLQISGEQCRVHGCAHTTWTVLPPLSSTGREDVASNQHHVTTRQRHKQATCM